jgi:CheY-like chemotaxis protein
MPELAGARILVVEDEYFVAQDLRNALQQVGAVVLGPVAEAGAAMELLGRGAVDAAILDINLMGKVNFGIANELRSRNIPFVFATGYEPAMVPHALRDVPVWSKPFDVEALIASLSGAPRNSQPPEGRPGRNPL